MKILIGFIALFIIKLSPLMAQFDIYEMTHLAVEYAEIDTNIASIIEKKYGPDYSYDSSKKMDTSFTLGDFNQGLILIETKYITVNPDNSILIKYKEVPNVQEEFQFDSNRRLVRKKTKCTESISQMSNTKLYTYNFNGDLIKEKTHYDVEKDTIQSLIATYFPQSNDLHMLELHEPKMKIIGEKNQNGIVYRLKTSQGDDFKVLSLDKIGEHNKYSFFESGLGRFDELIEIKIRNNSGKIVEFKNTISGMHYSNHFDTHGKMLYLKDLQNQKEIQCKYDEKGHILTLPESSDLVVNYTYDKAGNWISKSKFVGNSIFQLTVRQISYK